MYTVFSHVHELYPAATGLKLAEAWTLLMALAACDYAFARDGAGMMRLLLWNNPEANAEGMEEPMNDGRDWSLYSSNFPDNALARLAIMRRFVDQEIRSIHLLTDEGYRAREARVAKIGKDLECVAANDRGADQDREMDIRRRLNARKDAGPRQWGFRK